MGRLRRVWNVRNHPQVLKLTKWLAPTAVAIAIIFSAHMTIFANPEPTVAELTAYLQSNKLSVGTISVDGYQQIFYNFNDTNFIITSNNSNHINPKVSGEYIVWIENAYGGNHLVLYNVLMKTSLLVTAESTNITAVISGNRVVWEKWMGDRWQIYYYDGQTVQQLSSGPTSVRPQIKDNTIVYSQQSGSQWQVVFHDLVTGQDQVMPVNGEEEAWPYFAADGNIETTFSPEYPKF